jgi:hypothetical protein
MCLGGCGLGQSVNKLEDEIPRPAVSKGSDLQLLGNKTDLARGALQLWLEARCCDSGHSALRLGHGSCRSTRPFSLQASKNLMHFCPCARHVANISPSFCHLFSWNIHVCSFCRG